MKICKTLAKLVLILSFLALGAGCVPDSLTKWEEPTAVAPATGSSVLGPDGTPISVPAPTSGSGPTSFSYDASSYGFKTGEVVSKTVTFVGAPTGTNTYVFSSYDSVNTSTVKSLSTVGLSLDADTGTISGTPSAYAAESGFLIKAYHIQSGITRSTTVTIKVATDLETVTLYYNECASSCYYILTLDSVSAFTAGDQVSSSTGSGAYGSINFVDTVNKELYVSMTSTGSGIGIVSGADIDDSSTYITKEATISNVTHAIQTLAGPSNIQVSFFPDIIIRGDTEWNGLSWTVSPDAPTGTYPLNFGSGSGALAGNFSFAGSPKDALETTEYTVTVRNSIDQVKTIKVRFNVSNAPQYLSYSNKALFTVDSNSYFTVGDRISSSGSGSGVGKILRKFSTDKLYVRITSGQFAEGEGIDNNVPYLAQRTLISDIDYVDAVFQVSSAAGFSVGSGASTAVGANYTRGVVVYKETGASGYTKQLTLNAGYDEMKWSPGDMVVARATGGTTDTGIANVLRVEDNTLIVNMLSSSFAINDCLQNRNSYYDNDTTACNTEQDGQMSAGQSNLESIYVRITPGSGSGSFSTGAGNIYPSLDGSGVAVNLVAIDSESIAVTATTTTAGLAAGQDVSFSPTGFFSAAAPASVSTTDAGDIVNHAGHAFANGTPMMFTSIGDISGIFTNKVYYVVGAVAGVSYQLSSTVGGTAVSLNTSTSNGTIHEARRFASAFGVVDGVASSTVFNATMENGIVESSDGFDNHNPHDSLNIDTVSSYSERRKINLYAGEQVALTPSTLQGENIVYTLVTTGSLADTLPPGLSLNSLTGVISGTPNSPSAEATYRIQAINAVGSDTYDFMIQVHDQISLNNLTENAFSFKLHKAGQGRQSSPCRITTTQLNTSGYLDSKNIVCNLEAGELDLYSSGLKLGTTIGAGMCNFISFRPYQFNRFQPVVSGEAITRRKYTVTIPSSCLDGGGGGGTCMHPITDADTDCDTVAAEFSSLTKCEGDYTSASSTSLPNCDTGVAATYTVTYTDTGSNGDCETAGERTITNAAATNCGGSLALCISGPAKDLFTSAELDVGVNAQLTASGSGIGSGLGVSSKEWTLGSPLSKGFYTNKYLANYNNLNQCQSGEFDFNHNAWQEYAEGAYYQVIVDDIAGCAPGETITANAGSVAGVIQSFHNNVNDYDYDGTLDDVIVMRHTTGDIDDFSGITAGGCAATVLGVRVDSSNPYRRRQPYYDLDCLNASYDTIARIRLVVRDWNRNFTWTSRLDRVSPDLAGNANVPTYMDVTLDDDFGNNYNNRYDWDDSGSASAGVYETNSCGGSITSPTPPYMGTTPGGLESFPGLGL